MKSKHIIIGLVILLFVVFFTQKKEHAGSTTQTLSNEAIQNIAKVYADTNSIAAFNNIKVTGKILGKLTGDVSGNISGKLVSPDAKYSIELDNSGNLLFYNETRKLGKYILFDTTTNIVNVEGDLVVKGKDNTGDNIVRIGKNTHGDGATSTKQNVGIFAEHKTTNAIGKLQVNNFELGRKECGGDNSGMTPDKKYDYVRSNLKNSAFVNKDVTGLLNVLWTQGKVFTGWIFNNNRHSSTYGSDPSGEYDS
jgi:hypothetical protein